MKIVYFGDSVTEGQFIHPSLRWTTIVDSKIAQRFGERVGSDNRAVSGEQTRMALERFPRDVQAAKPDILTIQFGMNDCNCWQTDGGMPRVSEDAFVANLREMVARARAHGVQHIVFLTNYPSLRTNVMVSGEPYEEANARYSELICGVASELDAALCDIRASFEASSHDELERLILPEPDLLHLSEEGHRAYADVVFPVIERAVAAVVGEQAGSRR